MLLLLRETPDPERAGPRLRGQDWAEDRGSVPGFPPAPSCSDCKTENQHCSELHLLGFVTFTGQANAPTLSPKAVGPTPLKSVGLVVFSQIKYLLLPCPWPRARPIFVQRSPSPSDALRVLLAGHSRLAGNPDRGDLHSGVSDTRDEWDTPFIRRDRGGNTVGECEIY